MTIDIWLRNKILNSTSITQYTTSIFPNYIPIGFTAPCIVYQSIGFRKNQLEQNRVISLNIFNNDKTGVENINDALYSLFDTSTKYIRESSSNLFVDSVTITNNAVSLYDDTNKYYQRVLDLSIWFYKST